jgi:hypothetical protein
MIAKLNGASSLPAEAQNFLASYKARLKEMPEAAASEATIIQMYRNYYAEMGGVGTPPEVRPPNVESNRDNVTAFRRPVPRPKVVASRPTPRTQLPVALIFICIVVVYVGIRYFWH